MKSREIIGWLLSLIGATVVCLISREDPFFWDTVQLASKHAHFYFENDLAVRVLPPKIDSGHPPLLGYYLAALWKIFGKSLVVSHFALLPFVAINFFLLDRIGSSMAPQAGFWPVLIIVADPVFIGQHFLVSPDVLVTTGFLSAFYGLLRRRSLLLTAGIFLLCLSSMRGMMTAGAFFLYVVSNAIFKDARVSIKSIIPFLPGFLVAFLFLFWHWKESGWIGYHAGSTWAPAFEKGGPQIWMRNIVVLGWRWLDFGRFAVWLAIFYLWFREGKTGRQITTGSGGLNPLLLCLILIGVLSAGAVIYKNLSAHRYFLPAFVCWNIYVLWRFELTERLKRNHKSIIYALLFFAMASGNLWIYPRGISMDWDATLAHRPWFELRAQAVADLEASGVDFREAGSAFPNLATDEELLLNGDERRFSPIDFEQNRYIFVSNIFNDVEEEDYKRLENEWRLWRFYSRYGVWIKIYERP